MLPSIQARAARPLLTRLLTRPLLALILSVPLASSPLQAQPLSMDEVYGPPAFDHAQLSPSGRYLGVLVPAGYRRQLAVMDLDTQLFVARIAAPSADIGAWRWVGDDHLVYSLSQLGQSHRNAAHVGGLYVSDRQGTQRRQLFQSAAEWFLAGARRVLLMQPLLTVPGSERELIVQANDVDEHSVDLYRLDVQTGRRVRLSEGRPARVTQWVLDAQQRPRVAIAEDESGLEQIVHYRPAGDTAESPLGPWQELWRSRPSRGEDVRLPLSVELDGRLLVASNAGRDTVAVRPYDPRLQRWDEALVEHPGFDVAVNALGGPAGTLLRHELDGELLGFELEAERPLALWMDERRQALQRLVDQALPGRINRLQFSAGPRALVRSHADRQPARWYLLDTRDGRMQPLLQSRAGLNPQRLPSTEVLALRSRDGLPLNSLLLRPPQAKPGQALPGIVLVHGGPWARGALWGDEQGDMDLANWLASRGYAVLLPNFRGSTGQGRALLQAGRGQFGLRMQEDLEDVLQAVLARSDLDPQRLCISGASYGGYAALMAAAREPERYRCVAAGMPVTDLPALLESGWSDLSRRTDAKAFWIEMVGDPARQRRELAAVSPVNLAPRIQARVMLYAGVDDGRTPLEQAEGMRRALQRAGQEPLWLAKYGEGHGYRLSSNMQELLKQLEGFFAQALRPDR